MLQLIVFLGVKTKILHLLLRYHTLAGGVSAAFFVHFLDVALGEDTEAADFNLARRHRSLRVNNYCDEGLLMFLIECLRAHIDT